jgi:uncharacterized protein YkwD
MLEAGIRGLGAVSVGSGVVFNSIVEGLATVSPSPRRPAMLLVVPVLALLAVLAVLTRDMVRESAGNALITTSTNPPSPGVRLIDGSAPAGSAPGPTADPGAAGQPAGAPPLLDLGQLGGVQAFSAPAGVKADSHVLFVLSGPRRLARRVDSAPYRFVVDTRALPNGRYRLTTSLVGSGGTRTVARGSLRLLNPPTSASTSPAPSRAGDTAAGGTGTGGTGTGGTGAGGTTAPSASPGPGGVGATASPADFAHQVLDLTNAERAKAGCGALAWNPLLGAVAQGHSADMAAHGYFSHNSQDGHSPFERMKDAGYAFRVAGENIAAGQRTPADVVTGWMNSQGHRANILNCSFTELGVGYATGGSYGTYWTQDFGTAM